jgi:hypothetical protein
LERFDTAGLTIRKSPGRPNWMSLLVPALHHLNVCGDTHRFLLGLQDEYCVIALTTDGTAGAFVLVRQHIKMLFWNSPFVHSLKAEEMILSKRHRWDELDSIEE